MSIQVAAGIIMSTKTVQELKAICPALLSIKIFNEHWSDLTLLEPSCCTVLYWSQEVCSLQWFCQLHHLFLFLSLFPYDYLFSFCCVKILFTFSYFSFTVMFIFPLHVFTSCTIWKPCCKLLSILK